MRTKSVVALVSSGILLLVGRSESDAQQPQIPTLQVCNKTKASGNGLVKIDSRADAQHKRDGGGTPDVVGFLVVDAKGQRMAHAVGPVVDGHIEVAPTAN